jgi:hypothetical protein
MVQNDVPHKIKTCNKVTVKYSMCLIEQHPIKTIESGSIVPYNLASDGCQWSVSCCGNFTSG